MIYTIYRIDGIKIYSSEAESFKKCIEKAVKEEVNLRFANLKNTIVEEIKV